MPKYRYGSIKDGDAFIKLVARKAEIALDPNRREDWLQEGREALVRAQRYFDASKGIFETYAYTAVLRALSKASWSEDVLDQNPLGLDEPMDPHAAPSETGETDDDVSPITWADRHSYQLWQQGREPSRYGDPQKKYDFHPADLAKERVDKLLVVLGPREREIVEDYYGLNGRCYLLKELGDRYGISYQRVQAIMRRAFDKLRERGDRGSAVRYSGRRRDTDRVSRGDEVLRPYPRSYGTAGPVLGVVPSAYTY